MRFHYPVSIREALDRMFGKWDHRIVVDFPSLLDSKTDNASLCTNVACGESPAIICFRRPPIAPGTRHRPAYLVYDKRSYPNLRLVQSA